MRINAKEIKKISKVKNSFYDDLKIEFLFHSNHLEGSTFSKENLEKLMMNTSMLSKDLGTVLVGEDAVTAGLVNEVGGIDKAYQKLRGLMNK